MKLFKKKLSETFSTLASIVQSNSELQHIMNSPFSFTLKEECLTGSYIQPNLRFTDKKLIISLLLLSIIYIVESNERQIWKQRIEKERKNVKKKLANNTKRIWLEDGKNKDEERQKQKQEWLREERARSSSNSTTLGALAEIYK